MGASNVGSGRADGIFVQFRMVLRTILGRQRAPNHISTRSVCVDMAEEEEKWWLFESKCLSPSLGLFKATLKCCFY
jgi:hypothetical protein